MFKIIINNFEFNDKKHLFLNFNFFARSLEVNVKSFLIPRDWPGCKAKPEVSNTVNITNF